MNPRVGLVPVTTLALAVALGLATSACPFNPDGSGNDNGANVCASASADCSVFEKVSTLGAYYSGEDRLPADVRLSDARICGTGENDAGLLAYYVVGQSAAVAERAYAALQKKGFSVSPLTSGCGRSFTFSRDGGAGDLRTLEETNVVYVSWDGGSGPE